MLVLATTSQHAFTNDGSKVVMQTVRLVPGYFLSLTLLLGLLESACGRRFSPLLSLWGASSSSGQRRFPFAINKRGVPAVSHTQQRGSQVQAGHLGLDRTAKYGGHTVGVAD